MMKIVILLVLAAGLVGQAAGLSVSTADENTLVVDGMTYGILSWDYDEQGYLTLILEPLDQGEFAIYPGQENAGETFSPKKPRILVTFGTGDQNETEEE